MTTTLAGRVPAALGACAVAALVAAAGAPVAAAQDDAAAPSVWDGVYSADQAKRGQALYRESCARCHGEDLSGANARPLAGEAFIRDWGGLTLDSVLTRARTMPPGGAGSLGEEGYLAIMAYILEENAFPAGAGALTTAHAADVLVYGAGGPDAVPNFALVQVVGCLARDADDRSWIVTSASEPIRTRDPEASKDDLLTITQATPFGDNTFELMYVFPDPASYRDHRVEAKGFLIRREEAGAVDALNVTVVASLDASCQP